MPSGLPLQNEWKHALAHKIAWQADECNGDFSPTEAELLRKNDGINTGGPVF